MRLTRDHAIGSKLFRAGKGIEECANADQCAGWRAAQLVKQREDAILQPVCTVQVEPDGDILWA